MGISKLLLVCALALSGIAAYYSIVGLAAIFASAFWAIVVMATMLEISKLVVASWLYQKWNEVHGAIKAYLTAAVIILMLITSLGIFGFLSKAHVDQGLGNTEITLRIEQIDAQIASLREVAQRYQSQLEQLDRSINIQLDANRAQQAISARQRQQAEREQIRSRLDAEQLRLQELNAQRTQLRQQISVLESKVGPIRYVAELFSASSEESLDDAVRWMIIVLVLVFDPLAVLMLIAANMTMEKERNPKSKHKRQDPVDRDDTPNEQRYYPYHLVPNVAGVSSNDLENLASSLMSHISKEVTAVRSSITPLGPDDIKKIVTESMDDWLTKSTTEPQAEIITSNEIEEPTRNEDDQKRSDGNDIQTHNLNVDPSISPTADNEQVVDKTDATSVDDKKAKISWL
jgi:hypothetical protein